MTARNAVDHFQPGASRTRGSLGAEQLTQRREAKTERNSAAADGAVERHFATAHFEAIAGVHGLDVENFASREPEHPLDGRRHVLVHSVRELDDHYRALPRCTNESTDYSA
jgi:hypothetical protein